jgi:hypothetical protein
MFRRATIAATVLGVLLAACQPFGPLQATLNADATQMAATADSLTPTPEYVTQTPQATFTATLAATPTARPTPTVPIVVVTPCGPGPCEVATPEGDSDEAILARLCVVESRGFGNQRDAACLSVISTVLRRTREHRYSLGTIASTITWGCAANTQECQFPAWVVNGCEGIEPAACPWNYPIDIAYFMADARAALNGDLSGAACPNFLYYDSATIYDSDCIITAPNGQREGFNNGDIPTWTPTASPSFTFQPSPTKIASPTSTATPAITITSLPSSTPTTSPSANRPTGIPGNWTLTFDDEFNGTALDTSKWTPSWLAGNNDSKPVNTAEANCYSPRNVAVTGGALVLTAERRDCLSWHYASGLVETSGKFAFVYGATEARIWLPGSGDIIAGWPAWWSDGKTWPDDGEADVMEGLGGVACYHWHSPAGGPGGCHGIGSVAGWHTFGAVRSAGRIDVYYDGALVWIWTKDITAAPHFLIVNLGLNANNVPTLPIQMRVDYVRAWN